ncbi:glycosyltransferase family 4 protein [Mastigocladopsis repens]|uniref:glycosyltransferase family 4 protein n=1 Tax=Mastigocladopsis repens TaxID=221287 RepID=UPI0002DF38BA|nr:glycosyltransferase family 4 protein [Mastigocladopsis repens]
MKVILLNNYSMTGQWEQWHRENYQYPSHHLWGATLLPKYGIDVHILPFEKCSFLKKISQRLKIFGDLDQQLRILFFKQEYDVVYSGHHLTTAFLAFLRSLGIFKKPIVAITYQSFRKNLGSHLLTSLLLRGHDKLFCLNNEIKDHLKYEFHIPENKLEILEWGNDLPCYQIKNVSTDENKKSGTRFILSAGKTYRDYDTLIKAFSQINHPLKICSHGNSLISNTCELTSNIHLVKKMLSWQELLAEYEQAYAVAIPLNMRPNKPYNAIGLTSLLEAMSMGKAVVMTRNKYVGIDVEKQGIGIVVDQQDVKGWQQAISYLLQHPDETREMGNRSRRLCEEKYNLEVFSSKLSKLLQNVVLK